MSSSLFSVMAQSGTGSDWNWLLIFILFVVVLATALVIQARFGTQEADELAQDIHHHAEEDHEDHQEAAEEELVPAAIAEAEPRVVAVPEVPIQPDDLKKIEGIGPKVANLLNENGITTFDQLAETSVDHITEILEAAKLQMMNPVSWPQQAKLAAAGEWDALQELQKRLSGGR